MSRRIILLPLADLHCGYRFGLMRTGIVLPPLDEEEEGYTPEPTAFQRRIWALYLEDRDFVQQLAGDDEILPILTGDVIQGYVLPRTPLVTYRESDQEFILQDALKSYMELPNVTRVRITSGTGAHTGHHGSAEHRLAKHLSDTYKIDARVRFHYKLGIDGLRVDAAHHGPPTGKTPWVDGDALRRYVRAAMMNELMAQRKPPQLVLRGHYHDRTIEHVHVPTKDGLLHDCWGIICPGYSLFTDDYTLKATASKDYMTVGTMPIEVVDGQIVRVYDRAHMIHVAKEESLA